MISALIPFPWNVYKNIGIDILCLVMIHKDAYDIQKHIK